METADLLTLLKSRELLADASAGLTARVQTVDPLAGYVGFDPSADSLHVGHLTSVRLLANLAATGGQAIAVVGGATGLIGDPSGKSGARNMLDHATLDANRTAIGAQLARLLGPGVRVLDNRSWLGEWDLLGFLSDIGRHFSVGEMLGRDSVADRLSGSGISFTEFSYSLLQATDFLTLRREHGVELQMGGSDQWGNITAGIDLIRRVLGHGATGGPLAFGATAPLLTTPDGRKMGKTEDGAIFLDPARTSPFAFFQFWLNTDDSQTGSFLRRLTDLPLEDIADLEAEQRAAPGERAAQRALARTLTSWVHGADIAALQDRVAQAAFSRGPVDDPAVLAELHAHAAGFTFGRDDLAAGVAALAKTSGLASSLGDARRLIAGGGLSVDAARVVDPDEVPALVAGEWLLLRAGRKRLAVGRVARP